MNGFHVHGTEALAEALKTNKTLECLDISANRIPLDGAVVVARALTHNKGLKALKVKLVNVFKIAQRFEVVHNSCDLNSISSLIVISFFFFFFF